MNDVLNKLRGMEYATLINLLSECNIQIEQSTEIANSTLYSDAYRQTARYFRDATLKYRNLVITVINEKNE